MPGLFDGIKDGKKSEVGNFLAVKMKLTSVEWRLVAVVLVHQPITVNSARKLLRLDYGHAKSVARELVK